MDAVGTVTVNSGASFVSSQSGTGFNASASLTIGTLVRNNGGTLGFMASLNSGSVTAPLNSALDQILINNLGSGAALVNGILPWATVQTLANTPNQFDFATVVNSGGSNSVAAFTNYKTSLAAAGPTDTVRLTTNETLIVDKIVNAILFAGTTAGGGITIAQSNFTLGVTAAPSCRWSSKLSRSAAARSTSVPRRASSTRITPTSW